MNPKLIEEYKKIHEKKAHYGAGATYQYDIEKLISDHDLKSILDYGCGKGVLGDLLLKRININYQGYDPAIERFSAEPRQADIVVANDVFEHFDPKQLNDELEKVGKLVGKVLFANISCRPATELLSDGKNAHTTLMPYWDWIELLNTKFKKLKMTLFSCKFMISNQNLVVVYISNEFLYKQFSLTSNLKNATLRA